MTSCQLLRDLVANFPRYCRGWLECAVVLGKGPPSIWRPPAQTLETTDAPASPRALRPTHYVTSSLFLYECFKYLTRATSEDLHLVTGPMVDGRFVLDHMVKVRSVERSIAGAVANPGNIAEALPVMEAFGLRCGGLFHSHPGSGRNHAVPSSVDWQNQRTWESVFPMVGGVFSRDGFVTFFSTTPQVDVQVLGKKASKVDENLYKLTTDQDVPGPRATVRHRLLWRGQR